MSQEAPVIEVTLPARFETVWQAFRVPEAIRRWHGWEYDGLDAEIHIIYEEETTASMPDRALEIGGHLFLLDDRGDEVVVRVTRAQGGTETWADYYDEVEQGWNAFLQQLRLALDRHPGEDRRTIRLEGSPANVAQPSVYEIMGLNGPAAMKAGERYRVRAPWGEEVAGEVWFHAPGQLGVTVDQWGDGLLVVSVSRSGAGRASLTATTYGLDDGRLSVLEGQIADVWWASYFPLEVAEPG